MKKRLPIYCILILFFFGIGRVQAQQSITVVPEKTSILLGEPLTVSVSIVGGQPYTAAVPDSLGHFEVLERLATTNNERGGTVTSTSQYVITCFDSGVFRLPPIAVEENPAVVSAGIDITVNTLPADTELEYGDIKQIIDPDSPNQWPYVAALAMLAIASGYAIFRLSRNIPQVAEQTAIFETPIPQSNLMQQLDALKQHWEGGQLPSIQLGNGLMEIFRKYLGGKGISSTSKTGEELILATKSRYDQATWTEVVQSIRLCNAMRFGKYEAEKQEGLEAISSFRSAMTQTSRVENSQPGEGNLATRVRN